MITIFTPTYNRKQYLEKIYESLINQTVKNFIWLIIDDGSEDKTEELIRKYSKENKIKIQYIKQKNQGKHIAINKALENCKTQYIMCVDSDDFLTKDAIEIIYNKLINYFEADIWGIVGPRVHSNGTLEKSWNIKNGEKCKFADLYCKYKYKGDTYILINTEYLKNFKFIKIKNEKFVSENVLYDYLDERFYIKVTDDYIYISDYFNDGYTKNSTDLLLKSPCGIALSNLSAASNKYNNILKRVKSYARYKTIIRIFSVDLFEYNRKYKVSIIIRMGSLFLYPLMLYHYSKKGAKNEKDVNKNI